ncbi:RRNA methyltransferase AviRa [Thermosporothrix hazakensis]|jgi:hypothetical protein|uniref:rRNA methyltransferase AviRa n=1 Tax=Thermosporothrix hazakensis TaxID=644383 RepID=A0A326U6X4_THEHA|nr:hypothetical protein [Thermosporothrix hazakensis]PZW29208.1 RRNA methyltransferase AviRa [Thermosporothrix hazakensis]GCE45440.1 hypothetical protein KTH_03090 [Thermosporothrix hazakensis]
MAQAKKNGEISMTYRFTQEKQDYSDLATGRVLYSVPGRVAFPVRLASELFQRCLSLYQQRGGTTPCVLYDPCCGGASLLVSVGFLHGSKLSAVIGSDADPDVLPLAEKNLALLTPQGLEQRIAQLQTLYQEYGKPSHAEALESAYRLQRQLMPLTIGLFQADVMRPLDPTRFPKSVDLVMVDLPYGQHTGWLHASAAQDPATALLDSLRSILSPAAVVALITTKQHKVVHEQFRRLEQFSIGKRRILLCASET